MAIGLASQFAAAALLALIGGLLWFGPADSLYIWPFSRISGYALHPPGVGI